ncbi:hypothetical protein C1645_776038 [Glomus cerebriforme]|uniref:Uncharacterized protein n=1 Tax=Glomus cerebriforme TaxID=658196 RepID=A0A397SPG1_9GLOM|nr:hypothetical protein C1645_776038 [Glomus cerebriforme]
MILFSSSLRISDKYSSGLNFFIVEFCNDESLITLINTIIFFVDIFKKNFGGVLLSPYIY